MAIKEIRFVGKINILGARAGVLLWIDGKLHELETPRNKVHSDIAKLIFPYTKGKRKCG